MILKSARAKKAQTLPNGWKPYPAYKDSGIEWLGKVPEGWEVKRLKNICAINTDKLSDRASPGYEIEYLDISSVDSVGRIIKTEPMFFDDAPSRARRKVQDGDTVISTVRTYLKAIAYMEKSAENLIVSTGFAVLRADAGVDTKYLNRLVQSPEFVERVVANSEGVAYPAINPTELAALPVWLPPLPEQRTISTFLDRETAKIDSLIAKKERLIGLLEEKRTALISHAVTKGLDSDAPMKDSGVEWLGEVPEGWKTRKVSRSFNVIGSGITPNTGLLEYYNGDIPWVNTSELRDGTINETTKTITHLALLEHSTLRVYPKGTLLIALYGATIGKLGILELEATVNQACCALSGGHTLDINFTFYWFLANRRHIVALSYGGGQPNISQDIIKQMKIPAPTLPEQRTISAFLDRETAKIDNLVGKIEEHIEKLKEYRTALVSAAVTGKIDVWGES